MSRGSVGADGSGGGAHLSIGEVLAHLRDEFPDVTISKIRFLESQGLIDPERTPSGYRKFYDHDVARLRWVLHQQREHFLPLKVIKDRLDQIRPGDEALLDPSPIAPATGPEATPKVKAPASRARPRRAALAPSLPLDDDTDAGADAAGRAAVYTRAELARAAGLEPAQVAALESFGLLGPARDGGSEALYDEDGLAVAKAAAGFFRRGVEARHLRMYRNFAEREAGLFSQVLMPYVRQRNPEARARLQEELVALATLGRQLRSVLLRQAARDALAE
jgi:DNA-binding transcriptional MerR regulator